MAELRVVVTFPDGWSAEDQTAALTELQQALKAAMGTDQRLSRLPSLGLPGQRTESQGPDLQRPLGEGPTLRVFLLELPDGNPGTDALRALGGWYMRQPDVTLSLKADGTGGGVNLKLTSFSTVAFARTVQRITELLKA